MPAEHLATNVPTGRSGRWRVDRFTVAPTDVVDTRPLWARDEPGEYTELVHDDELFMTDLVAEVYTQQPAIDEARTRGGRILVTGLGLGLVVEAMLAEPRPAITDIVIIEQSADVVALVEPYLTERYGSLVQVVCADARSYDATGRFTVGWHDIWPVPQADIAVAESHELMERFDNCCDWQGAWPLVYLEAEADAPPQPSTFA